MIAFTTEELRTILLQLDLAIDKHQHWIKGLHRNLICRLPGNPHDASHEAYRHCPFGQWYYSYASAKLQHLPAFLAIELEHARMHQLAAQLLAEAAEGKTISGHDYDSFHSSLERLRLQLDSAKRELTEKLYNSDPLTGAKTRIGLLTELREQHELVKRKVQPYTLVMMAMDDLKRVNEEQGYSVGDRILMDTATFLIEHLRAYDKVFRYSGDSFAIGLPSMAAEYSLGVVDRLREDLARKDFTLANGNTLQVTASFGVAELDPNQPVEAALNHADQALAAARAAGPNCARAWDPRVMSSGNLG